MDNYHEIQKNFYNKAFENEKSWKETDFSNSTKFFIERFINSVISPDATKILEIGCGNGLLTFFLLKKSLQITAIDISEKAIESMKNQFTSEIDQRKLNLLCADILEFMKNTDQKFDVIIGSGIIHHIEKKYWEHFFSLVCEKLNPGGVFACGPEPNAGGLYSLAWRSARFFYKLFGMDYDWEVEKGTLDMIPEDLKYSLKQAGFSAPEIAPFQMIPHFHINILEDIDKKLISYIQGKFSFYIIVKGKK
jgi:2-polyprenyl-3-methyl-5-hydroxy-6-metoxy-1,4-benzoquinol methylase